MLHKTVAVRKLISKSVHIHFRAHKLRWKSVDADLLLPLNFDPTKRPRRQDWGGEFEETGMFYFSTRQLVHKNSLQNQR